MMDFDAEAEAQLAALADILERPSPAAQRSRRSKHADVVAESAVLPQACVDDAYVDDACVDEACVDEGADSDRVSLVEAPSRAAVSSARPRAHADAHADADAARSDRILQEALRIPIGQRAKGSKAALGVVKRERKRKDFEHFVTDKDWASHDDEETVSDDNAEAAEDKIEAKMAILSERVRKVGKTTARARPRTIVLNQPPQSYVEQNDRSFTLAGGRVVTVKEDYEPDIGVDLMAAGRYRARFASRYLGRFATQDEAARAHDAAAIEYLQGCSPSPQDKKSSPSKRSKRKPAAKQSKEQSEGKRMRAATSRKTSRNLAKKRSKKQKLGSVNKGALAVKHLDAQSDRLNKRYILRGSANRQAACPVEPRKDRGKVVSSCECDVSLSLADIALGSKQVTLPLTKPMVETMLSYDDGSSFEVELIDEKGQSVNMCGTVLSVVGGWLRLHGPWGQYARARQLSEGDTLHVLLSLYLNKQQQQISLVGRFMVEREKAPPPIFIMEPNIESEIPPEELGICYIQGKVPHRAIAQALKRIDHLKDLPRVLRSHQDVFQKVPYRMRVVFVSPLRGRGVWLLEPVPKGAVLFEYAGEAVSSAVASSREITYLEKYYSLSQGKRMTHSAPHYIYEIRSQPQKPTERESKKPVLVLDATYFGNVSRFVNHRCVDANLEVQHFTQNRKGGHKVHRLVFRSKRPIAAGEELTVDYSPGTPEQDQQLKRRLECHCGSSACRGWLF